MRIIRWVGHPSPLYDPVISKLIERQKLPPDVALAFADFEHNRKISVRRGHSIFTLERRKGFTQDYQWGPQIFDVQMMDQDWAKLAKHALDRYMFLDVTNGVPPTRPVLTMGEWREIMENVKRTPPPLVFIPPGRL